jgi:hypothetical protein
MFGNVDSREAYAQKVRDAKRAQVVPYAVAPEKFLEIRGGKRLLEGQEVTLDDLDIQSGGPGRELTLAALVRSGIVIAADHVPVSVGRKRVGVVAASKSITSSRGILAERDEVSKDDFGPDTLALLVERGLVVLDGAAHEVSK